MGNKKITLEKDITENIETNVEVENYIGKILENTDFDSMNFLRVQESENAKRAIASKTIYRIELLENAEFVSVDIDALAPYSNLITEKEFFNIVGANEKRIYKRSGRYQESLYSNYMAAKAEKDEGYIVDVLVKAIVLKKNIEYAKELEKDKRFMREWRKNFGKETPVNIVKHSGSIRKIQIIQNHIL